MKLVFAGTPEFAATALAALIDAGHEIALVLTQPDRPSGRGLQVQPGPVKALAAHHAIPVAQPLGLRLDGRHAADAQVAHARLRAVPHDAMVVAAYGLILPAAVLAWPRLGCINIHASLLPRWRGAAPIQRAIEAGDDETGITIMQMDEGLDTGPMLLVRRTPIAATETAGELTRRLALLGAMAIVEALPAIDRGLLPPRVQHAPHETGAVTYAAKLAKAEAALDFGQPSRVLIDRVRAFDPWPGCTASLGRDGALYKVWQARPVPSGVAATLAERMHGATPGQVVGLVASGSDFATGAVVVASGDGAVALTQLQTAGGKRQDARSFTREFGAPPARSEQRL